MYVLSRDNCLFLFSLRIPDALNLENLDEGCYCFQQTRARCNKRSHIEGFPAIANREAIPRIPTW